METTVVEILRTSELQRLRRIRQLGLGHFVFPGAEHSRLVHSLGVAFISLRFGKQLFDASDHLSNLLRPDESERRDLAIAALCHDLGHGPLSHAWEREVIGENYNFGEWAEAFGLSNDKDWLLGSKWHELAAQALLAWEDGQLHQLLELHETGLSLRVRKMLRGTYHLTYLPRLLSSDVDVDRCDYILRDVMHSGVKYGLYNLEWLISTCAVGETSATELVFGFDIRKAPRIVEQILVARRALYDTVYFHKTVRAAEGMVGLLLKRLKEIIDDIKTRLAVSDLIKPIIDALEGRTLSPKEFLRLDDYSLWVFIELVANSEGIDFTAKDIAQRIVTRDLFKQVPCSEEKLRYLLISGNLHEKLRRAIQPYCTGISDYYFHLDEPKFEMLSSRPEEEAFFVDIDDSRRHAVPIKEHDKIHQYKAEFKSNTRLYTIAEAVEAASAAIEGC